MSEQQNKPLKHQKSEALTQVLWKALGIALAVCIVWLGIEGGIRLYHRPAKLDARVTELEEQLASVRLHEAQLEDTLKGSLEAEKNLAPVAAKLMELIYQVPQLPMTALSTGNSSDVVAVNKKENLADRVFSEIKKLGDRLVRVQVVGDVKDVALTPAAQGLIRQQLRLHLVSARVAWLSRMPNVCKEDLVAADQLLAKHFQAQSIAVIATQKAIADLQKEISASGRKGP